MARILVVDDAPFIRTWCRAVLTQHGHEVLEAENGAAGVQSYSSSRPGVVLLDVGMRIMDGLTALQEIRKIDPHARVVMLTTESDTAVVVQAIRFGAVDFIKKPCDSSRLIASIERALA